jgi:protein-S-isoprenylcysteine O-methyltransferase Ste14
MGIDMLLVVCGWRQNHQGKSHGKLVKTGLYEYVRHPQYLGSLLITLGLNVMWLTIVTLIMWPVLTVLYWRLDKEEDKDMAEQFGEEFQEYKRQVPSFTPRLQTKNG